MFKGEFAFDKRVTGGCAPFTFTQKSGQEGENERKVLAVLARMIRYYESVGTFYEEEDIRWYKYLLPKILKISKRKRQCQDRQGLAVWALPLIASLLLVLAVLGLTQAGHLLRQVFCRPSPEPWGEGGLFGS